MRLPLVSLLCVFCALCMADPRPARPNIVVILADDMGFSDLGCYGGEIRTPNLDSLAARGLRFTQFYNTARCCPTRASLLTGLYPHQAGVGHMTADRGHDGYRGDLNRSCVTIAETLRPAGYGTYAAGKWHLTKQVRPQDQAGKHNWPLQRGFDRFYGTIQGGGSFYDPTSLVRDNAFISPYHDPEYRPASYYYTDAISDQAVRFVADHHAGRPRGSGDRPLFLYVAYTAAHWPMHAPARNVLRNHGSYDGGYGPARIARFERMKRMGLLDPRWELSPQAADWGGVPDRRWEARGMEVYAAMVEAMDRGIGRIVAELKRQGALDNTLVLYMQDNGGCAEEMGRAPAGAPPTRPEIPTFPPMPREALQEDMIPKQTRDGYPVLQGPGVMPGGPDSFLAYGRGWANVSNTPFREYKHWVHEGGISTPLVAHWPRGIAPSRRGRLVHDPGHLIDVMATCVGVSGAAYPSEAAGRKITPMEGVSLQPAFAGRPVPRAQPLFWEHEGNRAIRDGKWKLVAKSDRAWELYDMGADRTEMHDLAGRQAERVKEMAGRWEAWAKRANVLPLGTWRAPIRPATAGP